MTPLRTAVVVLSLGLAACSGMAGPAASGGGDGDGGVDGGSGGGDGSAGGGSASSGGGASASGGGSAGGGSAGGGSGGGSAGGGSAGGGSAGGGSAGGGSAGGGSAGGGSAGGGSAGGGSAGGGSAGNDGGFTDSGVSLAMSFFVTSRGMGSGGDLRGDAGTGLEGADRFCVGLAAAVDPSLGAKNWRAYLSTSQIAARDRVGKGPWLNAKGVTIATDVNQLHDVGGMNALSATTALDELGNPVPNAGGTNVHDIMTGATTDGGIYVGAHCSDWTSAQGNSSVRVGHCNRAGGGEIPTSWNSAHTLTSCTQQGVSSGGGRGSLYCFVAN